MVKLFQAVARLQNISYLCMSQVNLSSLEPELLVTVVIRVKELILFNCQITSKQAIAMFEGLSDSSKLVTLAIGTNNLSMVNKDTLATVINNYNLVYLTDTQLTVKQVTCLPSKASRQTKLDTLWLSRGLENLVDQQIVKEARQNIGNLHFM